MAHVVFISYASPDEDRARLIREDLENDGITCWMASRDILASEDYAKVIPPAIADARLLLLVLSDTSMASPHVYREVHLATDDKKPILPVRVDPIQAVEGDLKFSLSGTQWVNAVPRLPAALPEIRTEVRRLLALGGHKVISRTRSPFQRALASAFAWTLVAATVACALWAVRSRWFNVLTWPEFLRSIPGQPLLIAIALGVPGVAVLFQWFLHRRGSAMFSLDALFATQPTGALIRTLGVVALVGALTAVSATSPPAIELSKSSAPPTGLTELQSPQCEAPRYEVSVQYYFVTMRVGALNPDGEYILRLKLNYTDPDSVNFCQIWLSSSLNVANTGAPEPQWSDTLPPNRTRFIEIRRPKDAFAGGVRVAFTLGHPRRSPPREVVVGIASLERAGGAGISSPAIRIEAGDWQK